MSTPTTTGIIEPAAKPAGSRRRTLARRLASSAVLITAILWTLLAAPLWVYALVVGAFIAAALMEFFTMVRHRGILVHRPLAMTLGMIFTALVAWRSLVAPGLVPTPIVGPGATAISWMWDIFWPATVIIIFVRQFTRENIFEALGGLATTLFGLAYIPALFSYFFYLRAIDPAQGAWLVLFLVLVTKMGDAGAYAVGNLIGRHVPFPRISPRKTTEGFAGAVVVSALTALAARDMLGPWAPSLLATILLGTFLGLCGQLGDLAESLLKRDCQVKDASASFPGLGGVLDVIDSLLFTAPLFYGILIYS